MKKTLIIAFALTFVFAAVNAYASGEKNNAAKADATKAKAEMTSSADGACLSDTKAMNTDAGSCAPGAKAMTAEAHKVEGTSSCPYMKDANAKVQKADVKAADCPVTPGCCDQKGVKSSTASQKAEVKQEKKAENPVLIMSSPSGTAAANQ
jgi:hypothetical protein